MFLLLESGATKLHYALADGQQVYASGRIAGVHPFLSAAESWQEALAALASALAAFPPPKHYYYYGTGCGTERGRGQVREYFHRYWPVANPLHLADDLMAAARSLSGRQAGLIGILGTGSNVAYYDGKQLVARAGGLGYLLGDEGGGASLGRALLQAFFQGRLPNSLRDDLQQQYSMERETLIPALYHGDSPSRLLASFAPWLHTQRGHPFVQELLLADFRKFMQYSVLPLARQFDQQQVALTGSIAAHFSDLLDRAATELNIEVAHIEADPTAGLLAYHQAPAVPPRS
jgi:glucosamine kinase